MLSIFLFQLFVISHAAFKPLTKEELRGVEAKCVELQQTPEIYWNLFLELQYLDDPITRRHVRCFGIMADYYNDETGPKLDNLYEQYKNVTCLTCDEWYQEKICCIQNAYANGIPRDLNRRVYLAFMCFVNEFSAFLGGSEMR